MFHVFHHTLNSGKMFMFFYRKNSHGRQVSARMLGTIGGAHVELLNLKVGKKDFAIEIT